MCHNINDYFAINVKMTPTNMKLKNIFLYFICYTIHTNLVINVNYRYFFASEMGVLLFLFYYLVIFIFESIFRRRISVAFNYCCLGIQDL